MVTKKKSPVKTKAKAPVKAKVAAKPAAKAKVVAKPAAKLAAKPVSKPAVAVKPAAPAKPLAAKPVPVAVAAKPVVQKPVVAAKPATAAVAAPKKPSFKVGELVVYPAHGVGKISNIEEQEIAGVRLELYIVDFEKEKLRLKVPTNRAEQKGMRHLADRVMIDAAMKVIRGRARIKRTMWSRRAQEYDAKINSGDMIAVAEVIRDLYRSERQPEQSYSERQLFEQALGRFARELAAVRKVDEDQCIKELEDYLARNAKRGADAREKAEDDAAEEAA
jgi:CarD family transcriptional regulator